jgi:hypothetical protein
MNDIFDSFLNADRKRQAYYDARLKEKQITELPTKCGSCNLWMTKQCHRENTRKVSNGMSICDDFQQQQWVTDYIKKLKLEVTELNNLI